MKSLYESILDIEDIGAAVDNNVLIQALEECCDAGPNITITDNTCRIDRHCNIWNDDFFKILKSAHIFKIEAYQLSIYMYQGFDGFKIHCEGAITITRASSDRSFLTFNNCEFKSDLRVEFRRVKNLVLKSCVLDVGTTIIDGITKPRFPGTKFRGSVIMHYDYNNPREIRRFNKYLGIFDEDTIGADQVELVDTSYETERPDLDIFKLIGTPVRCDLRRNLLCVTMGTRMDAGFVISDHPFTLANRKAYEPIKCKNNIYIIPIPPEYIPF